MNPKDVYRATLFALVLDECQKTGMTAADVAGMFKLKNIQGGYAILNERKTTP